MLREIGKELLEINVHFESRIVIYILPHIQIKLHNFNFGEPFKLNHVLFPAQNDLSVQI